MKCYLVGGAVRDRLLGYPYSESDWVVVGATPEAMQAAGFRPVGRDFPVFLHPDTGEEYALARTERKQGHGYHGFVFHCSPDVTLEQDLARRDLTINAIAQDETGQLVDPYGGQADLERRLLRHVAPAFAEDPLRVLRVARFAARYHHLGFRIAPETLALMTTLSTSGELAHLAAERVWKETARALGERDPGVYFEVLEDCGALGVLMPELVGAGDRAALARAAGAGESEPVRFATLCAPLDATGVASLCQRLKCPNDFRELALMLCRHRQAPAAAEDAAALLALLEDTDALRRPDRFDQFLRAAAQLGAPPLRLARARQALAAARAVTAAPLVAKGFKGPALGEQLRRARLAAIEDMP